MVEKVSREQTTREATQRPTTWKPPSLLPDPDPRPGWKHRWVRVSILGQADDRNVSVRYQDGFEACKWEEYPEIAAKMPLVKDKSGNIETGGVMLCRAPQEMVDQRNAYYQKQGNDYMNAVNSNFMRENDPRMPLFNQSRSEVKNFR